MLGSAGTKAMSLSISNNGGAQVQYSYGRDQMSMLDLRTGANIQRVIYLHPKTESYSPIVDNLQLSRKHPTVPPFGGGDYYLAGGSLPGQIVLMYQAPVCGILQ